MNIEFTIVGSADDGYRVRDWFHGGQATLDAADEAASVKAADAILRADYRGADADGITIEWHISAE